MEARTGSAKDGTMEGSWKPAWKLWKVCKVLSPEQPRIGCLSSGSRLEEIWFMRVHCASRGNQVVRRRAWVKAVLVCCIAGLRRLMGHTQTQWEASCNFPTDRNGSSESCVTRRMSACDRKMRIAYPSFLRWAHSRGPIVANGEIG
jgi:hypothetical protein